MTSHRAAARSDKGTDRTARSTSRVSDMSYDAFISYDHVDADVAAAVQNALHRLAKPLLKLRALRVFRDATGLSPNEPLPDAIEAAIRQSAYLILIASPASAASIWVQREVASFLGAKGPRHLIVILADGELAWDDDRGAFDPARSTGLAPGLQGAFESEPLWVDLRAARRESRMTVKDPAFRAALVSAAAPLHGKRPDELETEDHRLQRRTRRIASAAAVVLLAAMIAGGIASRNWLRESRERARQESIRRAGELTALAAAVRSIDLESVRQKGFLAVQALHGFQNWGLRSADADEAIREVIALLPRSRHALQPGLLFIQTLAFSPDGAELVIAGRDTQLVRVRLEDGALDTITWPGFVARSAALSPDAAFLVTAEYNPDPPGHWLAVYDAATGRQVGERIPGGRVYAIAPGGRFLATRHDHPQPETVVWDLADGRIVARLPAANTLDFSSDGRHLLLGGSRASLWRLPTHAQHGEATVSMEEVWRDRSPVAGGSAVFSADGSRFATAGNREGLRVWTVDESGVAGGTVAITAASQPRALSRGGRFTAEIDVYDVVIHDLRTGRAVRIPYGQQISALAFSPRDDVLAIGGIGRRVDVWEISDSGVLPSLSGIPDSAVAAFITDTAAMVLVQGPADAGSSRSAGEAAVHSLLVDLHGVPRAGPERSHGAGTFALSPDGRFLAVCDSAGTLTIWNTLDGKEAARIAVEAGVRSIALGESGRLVATVTATEIRVLDTVSGERVATYTHNAEAVEVALAELGSTAWLRDRWTENPGTRGERQRSSIAVVDLITGRTLRTTDPAFESAILAPLGRRLVWERMTPSAGDGMVRVETLADSTMHNYPGAFRAVSGDSRYITTIDGGSFRVWDLDGDEVARIPATGDATPVLSPGARFLATIEHGTLRVWPLAADDVIRIACERLGARDLDEAAWTALVPQVPWAQRACAAG